MKNKFLLAFILLCFVGLFIQPGCKTAEDIVLNVTVAAGVTGTPVTGSYTYSDGETVSYSYTAQAGYGNVVVQLDGVTVGNSGVVTMNMNHTLIVTADQSFDPTGNWSGNLLVQGLADYIMNLTFSGNYASGSVSGTITTIPPVNGEYTITDTSIEFQLRFSASGLVWHMYLTGTIENDNRMTGSWDSSWGPSGTWDLDRD